MNLATNQRAQGRDRANVYMCHLDHLLQLLWADRRRVPPTEAARLDAHIGIAIEDRKGWRPPDGLPDTGRALPARLRQRACADLVGREPPWPPSWSRP